MNERLLSVLLIGSTLFVLGFLLTRPVPQELREQFGAFAPVSVPAGGTGTTTAPSSQVLYGGGSGTYQSSATSTPTLDPGFSYTGTIGRFVGGTSGTLTIATSTLYGTCTGGQVVGWSNALSSLTCIATSTTAGGLSSYDAWTHPISGVSATTSGLVITAASSTFNGNLNILGNATTVNATTTTFAFTGLTSGELAVNSTGQVYKAATTTAGTGLTYNGTTFAVNTSQNIATLSNLTTNGLVTTSGGAGTLGVTANGTNGQVLAMSGGVPTWVASTTASTGLAYTGSAFTLASIAAGTGLANGTGATAIPTAIATSSWFGVPTNGRILAQVGGVHAWVATTTAGTGLTYNGTSFNFDTTASFVLTGNYDFGGATGLEMPSGSAPTVDAVGEFALDTTSNFFIFATSTNAGGPAVIPPFQTIGFTYATTSWTGTTTIYLGPAVKAQDFRTAQCETDTGTVGVSLYDGTNRTDYIPTASTTINTFTYFGSNYNFTAGESRRVDIGNPASSPKKLACTFTFYYVRD